MEQVRFSSNGQWSLEKGDVVGFPKKAPQPKASLVQPLSSDKLTVHVTGSSPGESDHVHGLHHMVVLHGGQQVASGSAYHTEKGGFDVKDLSIHENHFHHQDVDSHNNKWEKAMSGDFDLANMPDPKPHVQTSLNNGQSVFEAMSSAYDRVSAKRSGKIKTHL